MLTLVGAALLSGCGGGPATGGSGAAGATAPSEGRIAFFGALPDDRSAGLLVLDLATGRQVRVGDQQEAWDATWLGPERVAVVRGGQRINTDGAGELVLVDGDGSDAGTRVDGVADVREVAASDDGAQLALLGRAEHSSGDCLGPAPAPMGLYLAAADGTGMRRVADLPAAARSLTLSPDGRTAAVLDSGDDTTVTAGVDWCAPGAERLVLVDTATGASRAVSGVPALLGEPRFSPDGSTVVLDGGDDGWADRDVLLVDVASAAATRVRTPGAAETSPVFSPDGRSLAVLRRSVEGAPEDTAAIALGGADATGLVDVVRTGTQDEDLTWTADGTRLVVVGAVVEAACGPGVELGPDCDVASSVPDVRVVPVAGGELRRVSDAVSGWESGLVAVPTA